MSDVLNIQGVMTTAQNMPVNRPHGTNDPMVAKKVATQFEGILVTQFLNQMFEGISTDGMFGGGPGESMFRSLMVDEYGKQIAGNGGLGLSDAIQREMLKMQEHTQ
jgi:Rod binding domain-containing protein